MSLLWDSGGGERRFYRYCCVVLGRDIDMILCGVWGDIIYNNIVYVEMEDVSLSNPIKQSLQCICYYMWIWMWALTLPRDIYIDEESFNTSFERYIYYRYILFE